MPRIDPKLWRDMTQYLRDRHADICRQWFFDELEPTALDGGLLQIHTRTPIQQNYLQKRCLEPFTDAAQHATGQLVAVRFVNGHPPPGSTPAPAVAPPPRATPGRDDSPIAPDPPGSAYNRYGRDDTPAPRVPPKPMVIPADAADLDVESAVLSPDNSFDNFIIGPNNQLAYAASVAVANQPGTAYNPLFIHGGVGLGKTHLLQAICQNILNANPETQLLYVSCDAFMSQFIACVQSGKMDSFRHRYRHVDLLVIDDIHFLAQRERSQEEFFHTFNELYQSQRQIVLSSDAAPHEIPDLEERLVSRFGWGMVANVTKPSFETRVAILSAKAALRGLTIKDEVIQFIARKVDTNARELEGAITTLQGHSSLMNRPIDLTLAREVFGADEPAAPASHTTLQQITDVVTGYYNMKLSDLQSRRRHKSVAGPRQVCMWLARKLTRFSLEEIGGYFGGRDHTTVMHSIKTVDERTAADPQFKAEVDNLLARLQSPEGE